MSPRKSSTSYGKPRANRPRYLGIEVVGEHLPAGFSPRWWEETLRSMLSVAGFPFLSSVRIIRVQGPRAIVMVDQLRSPTARRAWNGPGPSGTGLRFTTRKTWGTLVRAKAWIRR